MCAFPQLADPRRSQGQLANAAGQAQGVPDRVGHSGPGRVDAALPRAHHPERVARRRGALGYQQVNGRDFGGRRHAVLDERDGLRLALLVVAELLEQRPADPLGHAAPQLAFDQHRVDGPADLVGHQVAQHPDLPGARVHVHHGRVRAVGIGHVRNFEAAPGRQAGRLSNSGDLG
jgi:hypothetical protein